MATNNAKAEGLAASAVVGLVDLIRREKEVMEPTALGVGTIRDQTEIVYEIPMLVPIIFHQTCTCLLG